jgi:hypothetical protein
VDRAISGSVRTIVRFEGLVILAAGLVAYSYLGVSWLYFFVLFLVPDLSLLGYFAGSKFGAISYNVAHSLIGPMIATGVGLYLDHVPLLCASVIWISHIGFDRALGYGLKYADGFHYTHLGVIGSVRRSGG